MIVRLIESHLEKKNRDAQRQTKCFHVSQLYHPCLRYLYYSYLGLKQEIDAKTSRIFDNGHAVHNRLQSYLEAIGVLKEREYKVWNDEYRICGRCDGIVELQGKRGVLEIKSINSKGFAGYLPKKEHVVQTMMYTYFLGLRGGVILYENKDTQEMKECYCALDMAIVDKTLAKVQKVISFIEKKQLPLPTQREWDCKFCGFKEICRKSFSCEA